MRKRICTLLVFLSILASGDCAAADDVNQRYVDLLQQYEDELNQCTNSWNTEAYSTADMNNATYNVGDCYQNTGNKIIDTFYRKNAEESKKIFENYIKAVYALEHNIIQDSDFARRIYTGTMYNTMAIGAAVDRIKQAVQWYIKEIRSQLNDDFPWDDVSENGENE